MARQRQQDLLILGKAVQAVREQHGLSADDLATAADVPIACVAAIEAGELDPDFELLIKLAAGIGVRPSAFILRAEEFTSPDTKAEADSE